MATTTKQTKTEIVVRREVEAISESLQEFLGHHFVGGSAGTVFVVVNDRLSETRRFSQTCRARDDGFEDFLSEVLTNFTDDLLRKARATVKHGHHDSDELQVRIDAR